MQPPKYYDKLFEIEHQDQYEKLKQQRKRKIQKRLAQIEIEVLNGNKTNAFNLGFRQREQAKRDCNEAKFAMLKRTVE